MIRFFADDPPSARPAPRPPGLTAPRAPFTGGARSPSAWAQGSSPGPGGDGACALPHVPMRIDRPSGRGGECGAGEKRLARSDSRRRHLAPPIRADETTACASREVGSFRCNVSPPPRPLGPRAFPELLCFPSWPEGRQKARSRARPLGARGRGGGAGEGAPVGGAASRGDPKEKEPRERMALQTRGAAASCRNHGDP